MLYSNKYSEDHKQRVDVLRIQPAYTCSLGPYQSSTSFPLQMCPFVYLNWKQKIISATRHLEKVHATYSERFLIQLMFSVFC